MAKFKPLKKDQLLLLPPFLEEFIPENHLARVVSEIVDSLDTSNIELKYSELGQNAYHPKIILKILFYGYATGIRSGRKIATKCETDTAFMYLAQMYKPDFRTINDFRKDNIKEIEHYFVDIIKICQELGLVKIGSIAIDGTKIRANATSSRSKDKEGYEKWLQKVEEEIREILKEAEKTDEEEDRKYGDRRGDELPESLRKKEHLKEKIKQVLKNFGKDKEEKINLTDPDANYMQEKKGVVRASYNCQVSVAEDQIIVGAAVSKEANDRTELTKMIEFTEENLGEEVKTIVADSGYSSYDNYEYLRKREKNAYIPDQYFEKVKNKEYEEQKYHRENFTYDKECDCYICPEGKTLTRYKKRISNKGRRKWKQVIYKGTECMECSVKNLCTKQKARTYARELREDLQEEMREKLLTKEGSKKYKWRLYTAEPPFGHFKHNLGYKRFLLRTLEKVQAEFKLMCIGYNLMKICNYKLAST